MKKIYSIIFLITNLKDTITSTTRTFFYAPLFKGIKLSSRIFKVSYLHGCSHIVIGNSTTLREGISLTAWPEFNENREETIIEIGNNCHFGAYNHITAINGIKIGDGFLSGKWVTITDNSHGGSTIDDLMEEPFLRRIYSRGKVTIGKNVWVGDKATILPGVTIGEGAVVAANAVVTRDIPPYSIAAGVPATIKKRLK